MKLIAIDTATEACSVALSIDGERLQRYERVGREHSLKLPAMFKAVLAEAGIKATQLDGLIAGVGPGSFAGVRIGVSFVKGLGLGLDRPAVGVSSLAMLAQAALERGAQRMVPAIDARMDQVYIGVYHAHSGLAQLCGEEAVLAAQDWSAEKQIIDGGAVSVLGSGWKAWGETLSSRMAFAPASTDIEALPEALHALRLAHEVFASGNAPCADRLVPNYLRNRVALTQAEQIAARMQAGEARLSAGTTRFRRSYDADGGQWSVDRR